MHCACVHTFDVLSPHHMLIALCTWSWGSDPGCAQKPSARCLGKTYLEWWGWLSVLIKVFLWLGQHLALIAAPQSRWGLRGLRRPSRLWFLYFLEEFSRVCQSQAAVPALNLVFRAGCRHVRLGDLHRKGVVGGWLAGRVGRQPFSLLLDSHEPRVAVLVLYRWHNLPIAWC